ncbi:MAG: hypothetical protein CVU59_01840 [Deltaproteobacteria bacterium HGW-Deltaproteobacteria-17]|nr:MAG: hypothetical protein CVU59_01840 [Deltaproteobacteria bacterium HGW-Deltaproteobacteria-17]
MQRFEQMEERMEIVLTSRQIFVLAVLLVGVALVMFVVGFSMGKRSERRKVVLGTPQAAADLLTRLDEMEKESKEFVAKKALTQIRKREIPIEELPAAGNADQQGVEPAAGATVNDSRASSARPVIRGTIALSKVKAARTTAAKAPMTKAPAMKAPVAKANPGKNASTAPAQGRQVTGSYGKPRRTEAVSARKMEGRRAAAQN